MARKWLQFPEALYTTTLSQRDKLGVIAVLAFDAASFTDVEDFLFGHLVGSSWEIVDIEKTYAYGEMLGGVGGESIDFQLGPDLKSIVTFHIDDLDIAEPDDEGVKSVGNFDWKEIIESAARLYITKNDFSKKVSS